MKPSVALYFDICTNSGRNNICTLISAHERYIVFQIINFSILANATLIFLIDMLDMRHAAPNYAPMDLFTSLDKDNDKTLSREELSHYVDYQVKMYRNKNAPKITPEEHEKMIDDIMAKEDKNGDGVIQHSEFSGPKMPHGGEL